MASSSENGTSHLNLHLNRREFLTAAVLGAGIFLSEINRSSEPLVPFESKALGLDYGPSSRIVADLAGIDQAFFPKNDLAQRILGQDYLPRWKVFKSGVPKYIEYVRKNEQLGGELVEGFINWRMREKLLDEQPDAFLSGAMEEYPIRALVHGLVTQFGFHGIQVTHTRNKVLESLGYKSDRRKMIPVQHHIHPRINESGTPIVEDELGNRGVSLYVDVRGIATDVMRYGGDRRIIGFPLQPGDIEVYSVTNTLLPSGEVVTAKPSIKVVGAYKPDKLRKNLREMGEFIRRTKQLAIIPIGNSEDIIQEEMLEDLIAHGELQRDRLIIAGEALLQELFYENGSQSGEWKYMPWYGSFGADIYVDNDSIGYGYGASSAVATLEALADHLDDGKISRGELREKVLNKAVAVVDPHDRPIRVVRGVGDLRNNGLTF